LLGGVQERLAAEIPVPLQPLVGLHDLERVRAGHKYLTQQRIRIKSDGRHQVVELLCRPYLLGYRLRLGLWF
jgi:hypothetical protein